MLRALKLLRLPLTYLRIGRSPLDALRAVRLRMSTTPAGRRRAGWRLQRLGLRALAEPVLVRPGTSDFYVVRQVFEEGEYDPARAWRLPAGATILDLGGNIGMATLFFDALYERPRFLIVEPDASNRAVLERNCQRLIEQGRAVVVGAFVAAEDGVAQIDRGEDNWAFKKVNQQPSGPDPAFDAAAPSPAAPVGATAGADAIPCVSIPTLTARQGLEAIDLMKCDVEGTEAELFKSCAPWIGRVRHLIVETHLPYTVDMLLADLRAAGWQFHADIGRQDGVTGVCYLRQT